MAKPTPPKPSKTPTPPPVAPPAGPPPKLVRKPGAFQSAAGLLGRSGSGGFAAPTAPPKIPTVAETTHEEGKQVQQKLDTGGPKPSSSTKPHVPRPQGRAVSGGSSGG